MVTLLKYLFLIFLLILWTTGYAVCTGTGCTTQPLLPKSNVPVVKIHPNGTWKFPIESRHSIYNVIVSRAYKNGSFLEIFSVNSDETPHIYDGRYANRTKPKRSRSGRTVDILISNATSADGGTYSVLVFAQHETVTSYFRVYVMGRPTTPAISLNSNGSSTIREGGFVRLTCASKSTTSPNNPDWSLQYMFFINDVKITEISGEETRYMVRDNELMIADISKGDNNLNITCVVWEDDGLCNSSSSFVLHVSKESKYDYSDRSIHVHQNQLSREQDCVCECHHTALTAVAIIWSVVIVILLIIIMVLVRRHR